MSRPARFCPANIPQHVVQRGHNRQLCFRGSRDFATYACWLNEYSAEHGIALHAWVLMSNHVHLLLTPSDDTGVSRLMQSLGRRYVGYYNRRHDCSGTLWEGGTKIIGHINGSNV